MTAFLQHSLLLHIVKLFLTFAHGNAVMIHCDWLMYEKLPEWFVFLRVQISFHQSRDATVQFSRALSHE